MSDVVRSGSGYKGEVAGGGLEKICWGALGGWAIYEAIVRSDARKGSICSQEDLEGRGESFLKNPEQEGLEKPSVGLSLSPLGDTGHRWIGDTGW